ncbi:MAG: long-chain fatty acid--CoA ligase [Pseudonocardia sp. SCN 72-86]|nr:MAG: long-chain fatty acid--CoA ligase [Pseudonocardia sp. SCN 72-86]
MMDIGLDLWTFFDRVSRHYAAGEIVSYRPGEHGTLQRHAIGYGDWSLRVNRLMNALDTLGVPAGATVATLGWNSSWHLEAYFGVPCSGRVLHTLNIRVSDDELVYMINDAADVAVLVDEDFLPAITRIRDRIPGVAHVIVWGEHGVDEDGGGALGYEALLAAAPTHYARPRIDENTVMGLCYTSGTTGRPKGVPYTHRSTVLEAMAVTSAAGMDVGPRDRVLPVVPMFHAAAWGMPYACAAVGATQVFYAGPVHTDALVDVLDDEGVTISAGVPTVWLPVADALGRTGRRLPRLRHVICGGSRPPLSLIRTFAERLDIPMVQAWGMTETSPMAAVAWPQARMSGWSGDELASSVWDQAGIPLPGIEISIRGEDGREVPADGESMGDLFVRGPWVTDRYLHDVGGEAFADGWFATGDVAVANPDGYFAIADRTKDLIKSGGEWISSVAMEAAIMTLPAVSEAAVVAIPDDRWGERPMPYVALRPGATLDIEEVRVHLGGNGFARWQLPADLRLIGQVPKTAVGKFDKKMLRAMYGEEQPTP